MYDGTADERRALRQDEIVKGSFNVVVTHYDLLIRDRAVFKKVHFLKNLFFPLFGFV